MEFSSDPVVGGYGTSSGIIYGRFIGRSVG